MSHAESSSPSLSPAASSASPARIEARARVDAEGRALSARAFLIQLVSREVQLGHRRAGWLRVAGRQLALAGHDEPAAECVRLAAESWKQREQLVVLLHHLVARWNCGVHRHVEAMELTAELPSRAMLAFFDVHDQALHSEVPWSVLAAMAAVERLLADVVPFAVEFAGCEDHDDLGEAVECFRARADRATALSELVATLGANTPSQAPLFEESAAQAISRLTTLNRESAEFARQLANWRTT